MLRILIISSWLIVRPVEIIRAMLPAVETETVTRDELSVLADIAEESDIIDEDEEAVIQNLLIITILLGKYLGKSTRKFQGLRSTDRQLRYQFRCLQ